MTVRELPIIPTRYENEKGKKFEVLAVMSVYSNYVRHTVRMKFGYIGPEGEARQEYQGPMAKGPWVYGFALSSVIDNHGGTGAESERNRAAGIEFSAQVGDKFTVDGRTYELREDNPRMDYPQLVLIND